MKRIVVTNEHGFTLVESIVAIAVFSMVAFSIYQTFTQLLGSVNLGRQKIIAAELAGEKIEIIRNMPYADVGLINGIPAGKVPKTATASRNNNTYLITSTIRNIDDPFDGTIGGSPNDLSPADYKLVQLDIDCPTCHNFKSVPFYTYVAPAGLEGSTTNGALFVQVLNASGQPVSGANISISNGTTSPQIAINDVTNANGMLQIVDVPPAANAYRISASKSGYSSDQTYDASSTNPNPTKPHATVAAKTVTQITLVIDQVAALNIASTDKTCAPVASAPFRLSGTKVIGTEPDFLKYALVSQTGAAGQLAISDLEWDNYSLLYTGSSHAVIGTIPPISLNLAPGSIQDIALVLGAKNGNGLLVIVKDGATQLPLTDVEINLAKSGFGRTLVTGQGFMNQTDWSGGEGQTVFTDLAKFFSTLNVDGSSVPGELSLPNSFGTYPSQGSLISSTFDAGTSSNYSQISWIPQGQPLETGGQSVKFQFAANNDQATWNWSGPDGTSDTFYTATNSVLSNIYNNQRYSRYKLFLSTESPTSTPIISDIAYTFTSSCLPPGQVFFDSLDLGAYTVTASKAGYQAASSTVSLSAAWQQVEIILNP